MSIKKEALRKSFTFAMSTDMGFLASLYLLYENDFEKSNEIIKVR